MTWKSKLKLPLRATRTAVKQRFSTSSPDQTSTSEIFRRSIEHKIGQIIGWKNYDLVDLPGIYSIRPYSGEEKVSRDFIIERKPDAIINIVDATNIERNLYLTLQLIEMGKPMVLALNMMDELLGNHGSVDIQKLSDRLGIPVVPIAAAKNDGVDELMRVVAERRKIR